MIKTRLYLLLILISYIGLQACENQVRKRVSFSIGSIIPDQVVVAQGNPVNITASFVIAGTTNEPRPSVLWESDLGSFESPNQATTIWTAPENYLGDVVIKLNATFMGHSDKAERTIKIVKTPAAGYGSLSGNLLSENQDALIGIIVKSSTGETDTTDNNGYFYIDYLPQGNNGIEFSNIPYEWATEFTQQLNVSSGTHQHLGNIIFYTSAPANITSYQLVPDRQAIFIIGHKNLNLINFHELYRADNINGDGATLIRTFEPEITEILVQDEAGDGFYALKSIPVHGDPSTYSEWEYIDFIDVVDPDAEDSYFSYNNYFNATLNWQSTGFENYYKGFRVADSSLAWVSPLLDVGTRSYELTTSPGQTGDYYVIAITDNDLFNESQPDEQKITLEVPALEPPNSFRGTVLNELSIRLLWEPITNNNNWHSGYLLEKMVITDTSTIDWEELTRITNTLTGEYSDQDADSGNVYHYRISSIAYPQFPEKAFYSAMDSISLSTK